MKTMDPLSPSLSARTLLGRFRYLGVPAGALPAGSLSLHSTLSRLDGAQPQHFLHYNCWLLAAHFDLRYIVEAGVGIPRFIACAGISVAEVLTRSIAQMTTKQICEELFPSIFTICGVSPNPLYDACMLVHDAAELARFILDKAGMAIGEIFDVLNIPLDIVFKEVTHILALDQIHFAAKPEIDERALEIGGQLSRYDIVSLIEVWETKSQRRILAFGDPIAASSDGNFELHKGRYFLGPEEPVAGIKQLGSGILVYVPRLDVADGGNASFKNDGVSRKMSEGCDFGFLVDTDKLSNKGIQHTVIDLGVGKIDLYSTHMYSGGDGLNVKTLGLAEPSATEKSALRSAQVGEIKAFIAATHDPRNVAVIAGDFNIPVEVDGKLSADYADLLAQLASVGRKGAGNSAYYDLWTVPAVLDPAAAPALKGATNRNHDKYGDFSGSCAFDAPVDAIFPGTGAQDFYCGLSSGSVDAFGSRIDYIFVEAPTMEHSFNVDFSRVRRRTFKRVGSGHESEYLSDHLGLETEFIASART